MPKFGAGGEKLGKTDVKLKTSDLQIDGGSWGWRERIKLELLWFLVSTSEGSTSLFPAAEPRACIPTSAVDALFHSASPGRRLLLKEIEIFADLENGN